MQKIVKAAFRDTLPVMTGYLVLGFGFGLLLKASGYGMLVAFLMSFLIYAGSMQYVTVGLLTGGASLLTVGITTLMVNARHLFYGVSMVDKYQGTGAKKPYLIFALTDETYSLVCVDHAGVPPERRTDYCLLVSAFDHFYWVIGSVLGSLAGAVLTFNTEGIDFALTALFLTVFVEQWLTAKKHLPALIGVGASLLALVIFGGENFLIPAMLLIALFLGLYKGGECNA